MKILFPLELFYPARLGGQANTLFWLSKALIGKGHDVTVVTTKKAIDDGVVELDKWIDVEGIKTRYCSTTSKLSYGVIRQSLLCLKEMDVVVFSSICYMPCFFVGVLAKLSGKKIIWSPRGELFSTAVQGSRAKQLYFKLIRVLMGRSVVFHATSKAEEAIIRGYFPKSEIVIIPNYMELPEKEEVVSDYKEFLYVGRMSPIKALDKLIAGLGASEKFRQSPFIIKMVGSVEKQFEDFYRGLLKQVEELGLQDKVKFVGSLSGREKFQAYAAARYSFLVSNSENFGNVVIEALSQGTPVVASEGTPWARLEEVKAGFWIDNTPEEIAKTIDIIMEQSDKEYLTYRKNALELSASFDVYKHVEEWEKVIQK